MANTARVVLRKYGLSRNETATQGAGATMSETMYPTSNARAPEDAKAQFQRAGAIEPPFMPASLLRLAESSSSLEPCVASYAQNIHGFGFSLTPRLDLDHADAGQIIADALYSERLRAEEHDAHNSKRDVRPVPDPTEADVDAERRRIVTMMRRERAQIDEFFRHVVPDMSFTAFRKLICRDQEITGNGYYEVLRDQAGRICSFVYLPGFMMRLTLCEEKDGIVSEKRQSGAYGIDTIQRRRKFRKFVQIDELQRIVYFKEFGDRRLMSKLTGAIVPLAEEAKLEADPHDGPATEVVHVRIPSPRTPYGVPRWVGAMLAVIGQREAEEINAAYFDNKSIPPLAITVSGGSLTPQTVSRLEDYIESEIKGISNFHKILVLEAEPAVGGSIDSSGGTMKIDIKPLTDAQQKDALFLNYDERVSDKVGNVFRVPRILRGDSRDFNRATAEAAIEYTEQQVFGPEREEFDEFINRSILPEIGIRFWRFRSHAPSLRSPTELGKLVVEFVDKNILTPGEARSMAGAVFNEEIPRLDEAWTRQPIALTLAGVVAGAANQASWTGEEDSPLGTSRAPYADDGSAPNDGAPPATLALTPSSLAAVVTVNEARTRNGLPRLRGTDGEDDPAGDLSIAEFTARRTPGAAQTPAAPQTAKGRGYDVDPATFARGDILGSLRMKGASAGANRALGTAERLIQMRDELRTELAKRAGASFLAAKFADGVPDDLIRKFFPMTEDEDCPVIR